MIQYTPNGVIIDTADLFPSQCIQEIELPLEQIIAECLKARIKHYNLAVLEICWPFYRGGGALEKFAAPLEILNQIVVLITKRKIYFRDEVGKRSDIAGDIESRNMVITDKEEHVVDFLSAHPSGHHYNHSFLLALCNQFEEDGVVNELKRVELEKLINWDNK